MATATVMREAPVSGFSFENCKRNAFLAQSGYQACKVTKTGTTICAMVFKNGVILGADTRSTGGDIVANKNCEKLHYMSASKFANWMTPSGRMRPSKLFVCGF